MPNAIKPIAWFANVAFPSQTQIEIDRIGGITRMLLVGRALPLREFDASDILMTDRIGFLPLRPSPIRSEFVYKDALVFRIDCIVELFGKHEIQLLDQRKKAAKNA